MMTLKSFFNVLKLLSPKLIIQGGATGADELAKKFANFAGIECKTCEADWAKYGKAAGPIRNGEMLKSYPNAIVVAFPGNKGTKDCMNQALGLGMIVLEVK